MTTRQLARRREPPSSPATARAAIVARNGLRRSPCWSTKRQPRLLLTLVLGPFLILLAFGLGYRERTEPFRAWFTAAPGSPVLEQLRQHEDRFSRYVTIDGTGEEAMGLDALRDGRVDVVVVLPDDPLGEVRAGRQATVTVLHDRLDPIERTAIIFASRLAVDQMNAAVIAGVIDEGQGRAVPWQPLLDRARAAAGAVDRVAGSTDPAVVAAARDELGASMQGIDRALRATASLTRGPDGGGEDRGSLLARLDEATTLAGQVDGALAGEVDATVRDRASRLNAGLQRLGDAFGQFVGVDPTVLAQPFGTDVESIAPVRRNVTDFYAPAAIILIVQQFGVAFGALSFVRERQLGVVELFRAGPLGATEALLGKYLAYLAVGGAVAAALTAGVVNLLSVPMAGGIVPFVVIVGLTMLASIGLGLVISLASASDTQAVQYTLIALLASLFFSAFFLTLDQLAYPAKAVSWLLPSTYGISLLRDHMLRGASPAGPGLAGLGGYGMVAFVLALLGGRRRLAVER